VEERWGGGSGTGRQVKGGGLVREGSLRRKSTEPSVHLVIFIRAGAVAGAGARAGAGVGAGVGAEARVRVGVGAGAGAGVGPRAAV